MTVILVLIDVYVFWVETKNLLQVCTDWRGGEARLNVAVVFIAAANTAK